jgi:hypothetical protein
MELDPIFDLGLKVLEFEKMCQNSSKKNRTQTCTKRTLKKEKENV